MKRESLLWLLTTAAGAAPLLEYGQGAQFNGLRFGSDGKFNISVFEDLHFGEAEDTDWGPAADIKSIGVMNTILDLEPPTLAVLNGDLITGENTFLQNSTHYIDQIVGPLVSRNIPWASTYGNHDIQFNLSPPAILAREQQVGGKLSLTRSMVQGDPNVLGTSNYYLPVYSSSGGGNPKLSLILWFFDSMGGKLFQKSDATNQTVQAPDYVNPAVVSWFNAEVAAMKHQFGRAIPSLAFVHIPTYASRAFQNGGVDSNKEPGINDDIVAHEGTAADGSHNGDDDPFMQALVGTEGLMAVFSGHDHGDDWCMKWSADQPLPDTTPATGNGIHLCFGRHSGYGGYGNWMRGARQIVVTEQGIANKEVETWVRLEDGSISGHVELNSTYGQDTYPAVSEKYTYQ